MTKPGVAYPKVREPQRLQSSFRVEVIDELIGEDHPARLLWDVLGEFDLTPFFAQTRSAEGATGRSVLSPRMKLTLWLFAIADGVGSARRIAELTTSHAAYRWIVGDLAIGHHALSEFRAAHGDAFDALFTDVLSHLMHRGLIDMAVMAVMGQDGTRVRAAARAPSFRSWGSLLERRARAELHLKAAPAQGDDPELNHASHEDVTALLARGVQPIVSPPRPRKGATGTNADRSAPIAAWRELMGCEESKELKRQRGGLSEFANARQKGSQRVTQVLVRGVSKVFNVMVLGALSANLLQHAASVLA